MAIKSVANFTLHILTDKERERGMGEGHEGNRLLITLERDINYS